MLQALAVGLLGMDMNISGEWGIGEKETEWDTHHKAQSSEEDEDRDVGFDVRDLKGIKGGIDGR